MILVRGALQFFGALLLQWWWNTHLSYWGAAPQFLLVFVLVTAARRGPIPAMLLGFGWGLFLDLLRADLFGANALILLLCGFAAGIMRRQIDLRALGPLAAGSVLATLAYFFLLALLGRIFARQWEWVGLFALFATPLLNALVAVIAAVVSEFRRER